MPETALQEKKEGYENFHVGRGGEGNVHKEKSTGHESVVEKAKHLFGGGKKDGD